jgi:hypothetical protein
LATYNLSYCHILFYLTQITCLILRQFLLTLYNMTYCNRQSLLTSYKVYYCNRQSLLTPQIVTYCNRQSLFTPHNVSYCNLHSLLTPFKLSYCNRQSLLTIIKCLILTDSSYWLFIMPYWKILHMRYFILTYSPYCSHKSVLFYQTVLIDTCNVPYFNRQS